MMELNDFSSLIEIAVTLSIAFVAIEYVKTYTKVLCNQVFNFQEYIFERFENCKTRLVDEETLNHIEPNTIDGRSTMHLIEGAKRKREIISSEIETEKNKFCEIIEDVCEAGNMSSVSLWMFFYGITALFLIGCKIDANWFHICWTILTFFTILYSGFGWFIGKCRKWYANFASLRHSIISYVLSLLISIGLASLFYDSNCLFVEEIWNIVLMISLFCMYSNFIAAVAKVWIKAKKVKKDIDDSSQNLVNKCNTLTREVDTLINLNSLSSQMQV